MKFLGQLLRKFSQNRQTDHTQTDTKKDTQTDTHNEKITSTAYAGGNNVKF